MRPSALVPLRMGKFIYPQFLSSRLKGEVFIIFFDTTKLSQAGEFIHPDRDLRLKT